MRTQPLKSFFSQPRLFASCLCALCLLVLTPGQASAQADAQADASLSDSKQVKTMDNTTLTAISGLLVGQATDSENRTGCTVVLCPKGFTPGVDVPGFAPGSRETELMRAESTVDAVHGLVLSGGSAFGLAAADGVVRYLREKGYGFVMPDAVIPIVGGAVIYDLDMNRKAGLLPDANMGYAAAVNASAKPVEQGVVGVGTGARCGRIFSVFGEQRTAKSGLGSALVERKGVQVAALVVVNALGDVHDPETGAFLAGGTDVAGKPYSQAMLFSALSGEIPKSNTVLMVVATNVPLTKTQTNRLARMAGAGLARTVVPAHLTYDGDIVFALSSKTPLATGTGPWTENLLGAMGAEAVAQAAAAAVLTVKP